MKIEWLPVEHFKPPQKELLLVTGPSGYITHKKFVTLAYVDDEYRMPFPDDYPLRWQTVSNDSLSDSGHYPEFWARIPEGFLP